MKNFTHSLLLVLATLISSVAFSQVPKLSSFTSATATIYLDFDGQTVQSPGWNNGQPLVCAPAAMTNAQITEVFNRVAEDYRPFNINITTDIDKFLAAPLTRRMRIIVTPTSAWRPGVGGISYVGSFTWGDDTPGFVFSDRLANNAKYVAECCTHESGHTVGLSHQSTYDNNCTLTETYSMGTGSGEISWAPVMGNSYYRNMTGWNNGPTPFGCNNTQDNLSIITSQNGFTYRTDDFIETLNNSTYSLGTNSFNLDGVITTPTDKDAFKFDLTQNTTFHLEVTPSGLNNTTNGANLDVKVQLFNASKNLINTYNPAAMMNVVEDISLTSGTYYIIVSGTGNAYTPEYGSLGGYNLKGFTGALPIHDVSLSGRTEGSKHNLSWNVVADEPIKTQEIEVSDDAINFRSFYSTNGITKNFNYSPYRSTTLYYRLKVTSVLYQTVYSNVISLRGAEKADNAFQVSTLVTNDIVVNASDNYQYRLSDISGKLIAIGNGTKGLNKINVTSQPSGVYVIQLINNDSKQTERIIKQ